MSPTEGMDIGIPPAINGDVSSFIIIIRCCGHLIDALMQAIQHGCDCQHGIAHMHTCVAIVRDKMIRTRRLLYARLEINFIHHEPREC